MKIPLYWAKARFVGKDPKGNAQTFVASGWSFASLQEARDEASARAKRIFQIITAGRKPERYEYHDRPIREERLEEIRDGDSTIAVVTRNRYGALILNCATQPAWQIVAWAGSETTAYGLLGFADAAQRSWSQAG